MVRWLVTRNRKRRRGTGTEARYQLDTGTTRHSVQCSEAMLNSESLSESETKAIDASRAPIAGSRDGDAFISASEDKEAVARPIADALRQDGYSVWLDETELKIGDRLLNKIDEAANCRFGVVVLSDSFFGKKWTRRELAGLVARQDAENRTIILPVWHGVD